MKKLRLNSKTIFPFCVFSIGLLYLFAARDFVLGTVKRPGVGFMPVVAATLLVAFSLFEVIKELRAANDSFRLDVNWKKTAVFFAILLAYTVLLNYVGYLLSSFVLLFLLCKLFGAKAWLKPLIFAALLSGASYYIFAELLLVQLP